MYWIAHYSDQTQLNQLDNNGTYSDIDRDNLIAFGLYSDDHRPIVIIDFDDDGNQYIGKKSLIYRKRTMLDTRSSQVSVHLVGWQRKINGHNIQSICYVSESETVVLGGQWIENRQFMYSIQPLECEKDLV